MSARTGRPAGPAKARWRRRLTAAEVAAVEAVLAGAPQPVVFSIPPGQSDAERHSAIPSKPAWAGHEVVLPAGSSLPAGGGEKNSTATPSGDAVLVGLREQLALQTKRADELQVVVDEQQHLLDRKEVELEQLMQVGGTERQSAYIARLLAKITALGGDKKEFDQT